MKKLTTILLVAVLAAGTLFAGLTAIGRVRTSFNWDLDDGDVYFDNGRLAELRYTFDFDTVGKKGEGDIYAEVNAYVNMRLRWNDDQLGTDDTGWGTLGDGQVRAKFYLNYARLVGPNWSVNIEETLSQPDFVYTYQGDDWYGDNGGWHDWKIGNMTAALSINKAYGISFTYAGKYTLGVGYYKNTSALGAVDRVLSVQARAENVEVAEGLSLSAAAGYHQDTATTVTPSSTTTFEEQAIPFALKVAYAKDGLSVTAGADAQYNLLKDTETSGLGIEAVADAVIPVGDVTLKADALFMTNTYVRDTDWNDSYFSQNDIYRLYGYVTDLSSLAVDPDNLVGTGSTKQASIGGLIVDQAGIMRNALSLQVGAGIGDVSFTVFGKDLLNQLKLGANASYKLDKFTFELEGAYTNHPVGTRTWSDGKWTTDAGEENTHAISVTPAVTYAHDLFTVYGECAVDVTTGEGTSFAPYVSITTDTIINAARLRLEWTGAQFSTYENSGDSKGLIRTYAQITF